MAVGPIATVLLPPVAGFQLAATAAGIKKKAGLLDLLLVTSADPCAVAGVFTTNRFAAAPVVLCRQHLSHGKARALVVNSGNANAGLGAVGLENGRRVISQLAEALQVDEAEIFIASTGVIGEPLPVERIASALPLLLRNRNTDSWEAAAQAIMTTDTFPKKAFRQFDLDGHPVTVCGFAKGAGMIHPNMATLLAYCFTDAAIDSPTLQTLLSGAVDTSFNAITVDGDTSTNDTLMVFASGAAHNPVITDAASHGAALLGQALTEVCQELARLIVRDGEGATKFLTIRVHGAGTDAQAKQVAKAVAHSPLVKTACAGSDPNWGRILAAVGYAGVPFDMEEVGISLGEAEIVRGGMRAPDYREEMGQAVMSRPEIDITIRLGSGPGEGTVWTCDLTHEYIAINADYRS
ncbi:MAG: bifunctional glutamate N-acetyltransferase/amino-acid acetyltransferase ArgJ [Magnetococcales bacterium]|nr:bifunctional glutamate N-acetyltransferase/amino-acid acetyltransferase ArgJ [Magnetococcales bacterium]